MKTLIAVLLQSLFLFVQADYLTPDEVPLDILIFGQRNVTIYASASNPSRDPKEWIFWYDPLFTFDSSKDIHQYNDYVRFRFSFASPDFDQLARTAILSKMHPDVGQFGLFWKIEPLPIDTLNVYVVNQKTLPIPAIYPCTRSKLSGSATHECQFQSSSMLTADWMTQNILCGKLKFHLEYYIQSTTRPISIPPSLVTVFNLQSLRTSFTRDGKYIHPSQGKQLLAKYFVQLQAIDDTIKEVRLKKLFGLAITTVARFELTQFNEIWLGEDIETIINRDLFYVSLRGRDSFLFHLKSSDSPWGLRSTSKQTFNVTEMQELLFSQLKIQADWSYQERRWKIRSITVHLVSDILDYLQLALINQQYLIDRASAMFHRAFDCSDWSTRCVCQSSVPALVFIMSTQFIRLENIDYDFSLTGFTFEIRIRPDVLPKDVNTVHFMNFRGEYYLTYQPRGEVTFSVIDQTQTHLYTTSLQTLPLHQWTHLAGVYSPTENQLQLYVNGEFVSSITHSQKTSAASKDIIIGQQFVGAVRDFRLWTCALSAEALLLSMQTESLLGNETCLVGLWPMADGVGQIVADAVATTSTHPGTLGADDNPNLYNDPIWAFVLPQPVAPPPAPAFSYRMFRENITVPFMAVWGSILDYPVPADYDGDGLADFAVYRPLTLTWMVASSIDPNIMITKVWGVPGDIPVRCNLDGDKYWDFTIFRPSTAEWISHISSNPNFIYTHRWGKRNDKPSPGDFDGDGRTDFVVFRQGAYYVNPSTDPSIQWTKQWGQPGDIPVSNCDFDADGRSDFTVWTPSTAVWSWIPSASPWLIYQKQFGFSFDMPLCGDFDGDNHRDFVVYRNWTGEWYVLPHRFASFLITFRWGFPTDIPVGGDYDGDGKSEFGLWRPRKKGPYVWEIIPSTMPVALLRKGWGIEGDQTVIGDFDGDKRSDFTVWRPSTGFWYTLLINSPGIQQIKHWGFTVNDTAVAGDWDGDLRTDYTIYRPSTGYWYIMLSRNPILQIFMQWGAPQFEDEAVPGDFDGDGKYDFAVWRPSTGMWFILPSSNPTQVVLTQWGVKGDIPVTGADFDGDGKTDVAVWRPSTGSWYILPSSNPVYPFFGPTIIKHPSVLLPPLAPPPVVETTPIPPITDSTDLPLPE